MNNSASSGVPKLNPDSLVNTFDGKNERPPGIPNCTWVRQFGDELLPVKEFKVFHLRIKKLSDLYSLIIQILLI